MRIDERFEFEAEAARQFALERYDVVDTTEEYRFDHITKAAAVTLEVPCAAISFIDGERLWFKSLIGVEGFEGAEGVSIPRERSFCDDMIRQHCPLIIEDATMESRFKNHPAVRNSPFVRSFIGVPLTTPDGYIIGALCGMDVVPRQFQHAKIEMMERLSELVIHELELRQQADKDRVTGALTRSGFAVKVQKAISLHDRRDIKSTMIYFDVDLYKMVKHRDDHPSGNALLKTIISPLVNQLRSSDCIGRMGGTQFAILLTSTTYAKAKRATEELQRRMEEANAGVFFDVCVSEISSEIGIFEDWLELVKLQLKGKKQSGHREMGEEYRRRYNRAG